MAEGRGKAQNFMLRAVSTAILGLLLIAILPMPSVPAQAADEWIYTQPDAAGDVSPHAQVVWYDITSLRARISDTGQLVWEMKVVDLDKVTGNPRYCIFFKVDDTAYQTGARFDAVAGTQTGQVTAFGRCNWADRGTAVGAPVLDIAGDKITITIEAESIPELEDGVGEITEIKVEIGHSIPQYGGDPDFYDTLTPSVEPKTFAYGGTASVESLALSVTPAVEAVAGTDAMFAINVTNTGAQDAAFNLTVDGLADGLATTLDLASGTLAPGASLRVNLTIAVPAQTAPGAYAFNVTIQGPMGGNASASAVLNVTPAAAATDGPNATSNTGPAANETGGAQSTDDGGSDTPGLSLLAVMAAVGIAVIVRRRK